MSRLLAGSEMKQVRYIAWLLALFMSGCPDAETSERGCMLQEADACPAPLSCNPWWNACLCENDQQCRTAFDDARYLCNRLSFCQLAPECLDSTACALDAYCDLNTLSCRPQTTCRMDVDCPFGQICQNSVCRAGCRDNGDCALGMVCHKAQCVLGNCLWCSTSKDCYWGQYCDLDSGQCRDVPSAALLCDGCQVSQPDMCGNGYTCLSLAGHSDGFSDADRGYCAWVGCDGVTDCPNGFAECTDMAVAGESCSEQVACPDGRPCLRATGASDGICGCSADSQCSPTPTCENQRCQDDQALPCQVDGDCERICAPIPLLTLRVNGWPSGSRQCVYRQRVCRKQAADSCDMLSDRSASACQYYSSLASKATYP